AHILIRKEEWSQAAKILERVLTRFEGSPATEGMAKESALALAGCYARLGNLDRRHEAYRRALALDPTWGPACLGDGATLVVRGRPNHALEMYQRVADKEPAARLVIARLLILRNFRLPAQRRDWTEVERTLDLAAKQVPQSLELLLLRVEVLADQS